MSDQPIPPALRENAELWSGCIAGAFGEHELLGRLEKAGFDHVSISRREAEPFAQVDGIEFRAVTITGQKASERHAGCR